MNNLTYDKFDELYSFTEGFEKTAFDKADFVVSEINKRIAREKAKQQQIDELTYEKDLITKDIIDTIRTDLCNSKYNLFSGFKTDIFNKAWRYSWHKKDKEYWGDDKEKARENKKEYKNCFELVTDYIKRHILSNDDTYELVEIIDSNFSRAYCFQYKYKDQLIQLTIPMWHAADASNYQEMLGGYRLNYQSPRYKHCWDFICCDIDYRKVSTVLADWVKENAKDPKEE
jgi:hypothetical protein